MITLQTPWIDVQAPVSVPAPVCHLCPAPTSCCCHPTASPAPPSSHGDIPGGESCFLLTHLLEFGFYEIPLPLCFLPPFTASTHPPPAAFQSLCIPGAGLKYFQGLPGECCMDTQQLGTILTPEMVGKLKKDGSAVPNGCQPLPKLL